MRNFWIASVLLVLFIGNAWADVSVSTSYYQLAAKRMGNSLYYEITYDKEFRKGVYWEAAIGYSDIEITDMTFTRREFLKFVPIKVGLKYKWKGISFRSGVAYHLLHLDVCPVDDEFGAYWGIEVEVTPNIYINVTQVLGDLKIEYPLLEDRTTMQGWLLGGGIRF